jgi:hypothetical protein
LAKTGAGARRSIAATSSDRRRGGRAALFGIGAGTKNTGISILAGNEQLGRRRHRGRRQPPLEKHSIWGESTNQLCIA